MNHSSTKSSFDFFEKFFHWFHGVNLIVLLLTGMQIHSGAFNPFGGMANARTLHFFMAWTFVFIGIYHTYRFFARGKYVTSFPTPFKNKENFKQTIRYYLFLEDKLTSLGEGGKDYNELQKLSYLMLFILSGIQIFLGFSLFWPQTFWPLSGLLGGLQWVRYLHYLVGWLFTFFTLVHLYLVFAHGLRLFKRMKF